jgi:selenocysteine lyase/cysteine desulfurase
MHDYDTAVEECRAAYGRLTRAREVAVGHGTAGFVGTIAASVEPGGNVVVARNDFTSVTWPFFVQQVMRTDCRVRVVSLSDLDRAVDRHTRLIAVSAVQSRNGELANLHAIERAASEHGCETLIDVTQSAGWLPIDARRFDYVICSSYKWLLTPRGVAFMAISERGITSTLPTSANWYAGASRNSALYGDQLQLAEGARQFDVSPAWLCWLGAVPALELIESIGVETINAHNVALANQFREGREMPQSESAIVSVTDVEDAERRLQEAGIKASIRDGGVRLAFHLYNTEDDVDRALNALAA